MPAQKNRNRLLAVIATPEPPPTVRHMNGSDLAAFLMDPQRTHTVVVVSFLPENALRIDAQEVAALLGADAQVFELANGPETHKLQKGVPERLHVFGNSARVYPHGAQWMGRTPRPHILHSAAYLPQLYTILEHDFLAAEHFESNQQSTTTSLPVLSEAEVKGFPSDDRAMVELLSNGQRAVIRGEDLLPGIPLEWLLHKGQRLTGIFDPATDALNVKSLLLPHASPVTVYKHGDVALARVKSVTPSHALVHLWPGSDFRIGVARISSNDLDSAVDLLTEGEVVRVRVLYENGAVVLSMLDVDDDEPAITAPPLLRGGPPWLDYDRPYASIFTAATSVAGLAPSPAAAGSPAGVSGVGQARTELAGPDSASEEALLTPAERRTALRSTQMQLELARHTIAELLEAQKRQGATDKVARALQDQLEAERRGAAELARLHNTAEHQIEALREDLARTKSALVQLKQQRRSTTSRTDAPMEKLFLDSAEQFKFDVQLAWARLVPAVDKAAHPLSDYGCSAHFLASWSSITEQQRSKTLRAVVDLAAGMTGSLRKREAHPLRLNEGAHAGLTMRGEDVCMRLYVEKGTAGALRLHYWKLGAGGVELHEVVSHDVVKP
ncbi:hypothetical protein [Arthrobacter glacialis]|uniref:hypothetical protein n=1 Tax=Arthrobacter glacialis TaxID=1664 RepID=UPI000CD41D7D|nr:hypothetical protein [Arthrobacter glacialis]POH60170.1 hypothetical protein CVS28_04285 [Arthrobacter glacialis]